MTLPPITNKQKQILILLYRFRFLNRIQIQTLLQHKTHNRTNAWLKDLTEKNYIGRILDQTSKINIVPAKYCLSVNAIRLLRTHSECENEYLKKIYKEPKRSDAFINRCIFIADIYLDLLDRNKANTEFTFYTQSEYSIDGIIKEIFPHFVWRRMAKEPYYIAEIFADSMPRKAIRPRIEQYIHFFTQGEWNQHELPPTLLFICPEGKMMGFIKKYTKQILDESDAQKLSVFVTTRDQILMHGIQAEVWEEVDEDD